MKNLGAQVGWTFCLGFGLLSCSQEKQADDKIVVEGNVRNIPDGKLYLANAHYGEILLDSTECKAGRFRFELKADSSFTPVKAAIQYKYNPYNPADSPDKAPMSVGYRLAFRNHTIGADSLKSLHTGFFLEEGYTRIVGDMNGKEKGRVFGSKETDLMYSLHRAGFGWLGNMEGEKRSSRLNFFKQKIKDNPYSYYLLSEIQNAKDQYSEQELKELLTLFNQDVQESAAGSKIKKYLVNRVDPDEPYPNYNLAGPNNQKGWMMDNGAKVNMLVFWASWCGPCRKEIPQLKALHAAYKAQGLNMVSVSIDEKPENWQKALGQEKMSWPQLIVDKEQISSFQEKFNFAAIPLIIMTDSRGKELKRFVGYEDNNDELYRAFLKEKLGAI